MTQGEVIFIISEVHLFSKSQITFKKLNQLCASPSPTPLVFLLCQVNLFKKIKLQISFHQKTPEVVSVAHKLTKYQYSKSIKNQSIKNIMQQQNESRAFHGGRNPNSPITHREMLKLIRNQKQMQTTKMYFTRTRWRLSQTMPVGGKVQINRSPLPGGRVN